MKLALIGGGRMGEALLTGLLAACWAEPGDLGVVEQLADRRDVLEKQFPGVGVLAEAPACDGAVIAVKPNDVERVCEAIAGVGCQRVLSIAAGVPLARLEGALGEGVAVVRAMPNTPALVGAGAAAIAGGSHAGDGDLEWAESILTAVGTVVRVPEQLLDAVTGLSGSGPAFVFLVAEALTEAGVLAGLPRDVSTALAHQTLLGSARLLTETGESAESLRAMVTSPGGTTAAGLHTLESAAVRAAFLDAVRARDRKVQGTRPRLRRSRRHEGLRPDGNRSNRGVQFPQRRKGFPMAQPRARFLTVHEVADLLRVSTMTVYRIIKGGDLRAVRVGKSYRVREDDLDAFIANQYTQAG